MITLRAIMGQYGPVWASMGQYGNFLKNTKVETT